MPPPSQNLEPTNSTKQRHHRPPFQKEIPTVGNTGIPLDLEETTTPSTIKARITVESHNWIYLPLDQNLSNPYMTLLTHQKIAHAQMTNSRNYNARGASPQTNHAST